MAKRPFVEPKIVADTDMETADKNFPLMPLAVASGGAADVADGSDGDVNAVSVDSDGIDGPDGPINLGGDTNAPNGTN